ncbi:GH15 family glucan-1,4-alpha-glucosidase [Nocardioides zeae]|uniref:GH15 family glucan-1,4-alpha-glucosidase n=2 Tax=Nocardioides zeae TaxID=1457234 RepID=A0AAJ1X3R4_9ACTN|nr:hypothetical protein [Nocardioides zeae]MDQ1106684.1 GH15 family glucan-1,4-alpha-glucosidase [Nocardioides zeae]MDR6173653.1 GH15 family glucan-1,4-alpha-glucosidase [Nocardioides zeae]MDR6211058.1 GH15 family glucan-1,4-alpha-glucosidase [Nocardioides zeae]
MACWEEARGRRDHVADLLRWAEDYTTFNDFLSEQVHAATGAPVAALPMPWAHGMVLLVEAALAGRQVRRLAPAP